MTPKQAVYLFSIFFMMLVVTCAAGISQQSRSKVSYTGSFSTLQKTPDAHKGEVVMLGGRIIKVKTGPPLFELYVLQLPLGFSGWPEDSDRSEGRFIVQSKRLLDPAVYQKDVLLTVVGALKESKILPIGGFEYAYPVFDPIEIKIWPKVTPSRPIFHIGNGVGTSF